ncbi:MAG: hypothetical protein HRT68_06190, partial [Flavobacteriaceae bacterium]|nr:hypothetical protein [Flavobacteriaceae bacterium]
MSKQLVHKCFKVWETGDFLDLPITDDFKHTSPYEVRQGKVTYTELVEGKKDTFLGHRFELYDELHGDQKTCVRYTAIQVESCLEVTEW